MTRPKAPKSKSRATSVPAAGGQVAAAQQAAGAAQAGAKKRPGAEGGAAAAAAGGGEPGEVDQLERKRMQVAEELRQVEKQIFDLESNYFQISNSMGNAVRGYEGFLGGSKKAAPPVQPEERLFSWSSVSGQLGGGGAGVAAAAAGGD